MITKFSLDGHFHNSKMKNSSYHLAVESMHIYQICDTNESN